MRNSERYSEDWKDVIRPRELLRAGYKCENCRAKHRSIGYRNSDGVWIECDKFMIEWCQVKGIKTKKLFLQVAHLDHNPRNNEPYNLKVLCPKCHLKNDENVRLIKRKSK